MPPASSGSPPQEPEHSPLALAAFNAVFWPYLFTTTALTLVPTLGLYALSVFDKKKTLLRRFTEEWGAHYLERSPGAGVTVIGREKIDPDRAVIYAANHQSMCDILAIMSARLPALWVSKVENFYAPFLGLNMYLNGYIPVRRGYLPSIMKMMRLCLKKLADGDSLIVFPEGTRSDDGNLKPFFRGAFVLSCRSKAPIVPIVVTGTGGTTGVLRKGSMTVRPQQVIVKILDPIDPALVGYDNRKLRDLVRSVMEHEIARSRNLTSGAASGDRPAREEGARA